MEFGEKLRDLRKASGYSQRELADLLDVSFTYLSKLENNRMDRPPSEDLIRRMAEVLKTDADELLVLAERIPTDIAEIILDQPESIELLRSMEGLSRDEWREWIQEIKRRRENR
jgi:HTH-type transcriptional regulator, competence development regulator